MNREDRQDPRPKTTATGDRADTVIRCRDVVKRYRSTEALSGVSLEVERGSLFGFLGPNGAGKSTLVKILTGLVRNWQGEVQVLGGTPGIRAVQRHTGYLPELFRFPGWLTGTELLEFHGRLAGVPVDSGELLNMVGLSAAAGRRIAEYSKGMQQRLGLAQALIGEPQVVFLDEPTSALDPLGRLDVRDVLLQLQSRGTTVFLNSHLLTEVEKVCDRVAVIDRGRIVAHGPTATLLSATRAHVRTGPLEDGLRDRMVAEAARLIEGTDPRAAVSWGAGVLSASVASEEDVALLVQMVVGMGAPVYEAGLDRRSLEEAFVDLLGPREDPT